MADFGFVGPSYEAASIYQESQECINFYPEIDTMKQFVEAGVTALQSGQRGVVALYPTPGQSLELQLAGGAIRAMRTLSGSQWLVVVCGPNVYAINNLYQPTLVGTLTTVDGPVSITDNVMTYGGLTAYIVDGENRYYWIAGNSSTLSLEANVSGSVQTVTLSAPGANYNVPTAVVGSPDIGAGAAAWVAGANVVANQLVSYGQNNYLYLTDGVSGTTPPTFTSGQSADGTATIECVGTPATIDLVVSSSITTITLTNGGSNYTNPQIMYGTQWSASLAVTEGEQLYYGNNLYTIVTSGTTGSAPPVFTSVSAPAWAASTYVTAGKQVYYGANLYTYTAPGITGSSPPTFTSGSTLDGTAQITWTATGTYGPQPDGSATIIWAGAPAASTAVFASAWAANTAYVSGDYVFYGSNLYEYTGAGTSGSSPPIFVTGTTFDGTALLTWVASGTYGSGIIAALNNTSFGSGYNSTPTVTITDSTGSGAVITLTSTCGQIASANITSNGLGYINPPAVTITDSLLGSGASVTTALGTLSFNVISTNFTIGEGQVLTGPSGTVTVDLFTQTEGSGTGGLGSYTVTPSVGTNIATFTAPAFQQLPTSDGPWTGGGICDVVDNYIIFTNPGTQQWGVTDIGSPWAYNAGYGDKDGSPDNLVSLIVDKRQVFLLGEYTAEMWTDVGAVLSGLASFPFERVPGTSIQHGIAAPFSVARLGEAFAFVSQDTRGQAIIAMMQGGSFGRISTHAVEQSLLGQNVKDAVAYTYQMEGHEFYVVTFPSINLTWVYDIRTQLWHKWLSWNGEQFNRHNSSCSALFNGQVLIGDYQNGNIYSLSNSVYTDNGNAIRRLRRTPHLVADFQRTYFAELQIQFQPGVGTTGFTIPGPVNQILVSPYTIPATGNLTIGANQTLQLGIPNVINAITPTTLPQAMLRWSNDGGSTWSNEHWVSVGGAGKYKNRAIWRRLGWARDRVFEVAVTDPVKMVIVSANLKAEGGEN